MEKRLKDYLNLYIGCECSADDNKFKLHGVELTDTGTLAYDGTMIDGIHQCWWVENCDFKILLRPLSDMTEEEAIGWATLRVQPMTVLRVLTITNDGIEFEYESFEKNRIMRVFPDELSPTVFRLLLKNGFDLFDLIKDGIAIDKTKLTAHA